MKQRVYLVVGPSVATKGVKICGASDKAPVAGYSNGGELRLNAGERCITFDLDIPESLFGPVNTGLTIEITSEEARFDSHLVDARKIIEQIEHIGELADDNRIIDRAA